MSDLVAQISSYQANNRNRLPVCDAGSSATVKCDVTPNDDGEITGTPASSTWDGFYKNYLITDGDVFEDPNGNPYRLQIQPCETTDAGKDCVNAAQRYDSKFYEGGVASDDGTVSEDGQNYRVLLVTGAVCEGEKTVATSGSRKVAVVYKLEGGGTFCQGN